MAFIVHTTTGPVPVSVTLRDPSAITILAIRGAMGPREQMVQLHKNPDASVILVHLPGMHTPFFAVNSILGFAGAFDQVLERLGAKRTIVLGLSAGGLAGLAMTHTSIQRLILVDTPLSTLDLWPLEAPFAGPAKRVPTAGRWLHDILGYRADGWDERGYAALLDDLATPTMALFGEAPLQPRRPIERTPSLVSEADRVLYRHHPMIRTRIALGAGHNIPRDGPEDLIAALRDAYDGIIADAA